MNSVGWMNDLMITYDNYIDAIDVKDITTSLLPIAHSTQNAQIEITIDEQGNFITANKVAKEDAVTLIPVTEDSASRGNGNFPHALCDKLCYVAGDFNDYFVGKDYTEYYKKYINNLKHWVTSSYTHNKVKAIFNYLNKRTVIRDLINKRVLELDENNKLTDKIKIQGNKQTDAFVRFIVRSFDITPKVEKVWEDEEVINNYINYYTKEKLEDKSLCYVLGKEEFITTKHPSKIRNAADKGKLISANDQRGFTYRGRFKDGNQAVSVSYIASQKAHNALRWLIQRQGYRYDGATIVSWSIDGSSILDITKDSYDLFPEYMNGLIDKGESFAERLNLALKGYRANLEDTSQKIVVMSLDAATTGRLSINFYREIRGSDFLERIEKWQKETWWHHRKFSEIENKPVYYTGSPSVRDIAIVAFATKKSISQSEQKIIRSTVERLVQCIVDGSRIPVDIVRAAVNKVTYHPKDNKENRNDWLRALRITCSVIKKHRIDRYKEVWNVSLDKTNTDRNYLFGRLLAVADRIEYLALLKSGTQSRENIRPTNAMRYMASFSKRPGKTWKIIYENLIPYINRLHPGQKAKYKGLMDEIGSMFEQGDFNNRPLNELYLLGFYSQNADFRNQNEELMEEEKVNVDE